METASVLQRKLSLREIVDAGSIQAVCDTFAALYGVAIKIFDNDGNKVVDAKAESGLCAYVFAFPKGRAQCIKTVGEIRSTSVEGQTSADLHCFTGNKYKIVPIKYDMELLGKLVFGPYLPADLKELPETLVQIDKRVEKPMLEHHASKYRRLEDDAVERIVEGLAKVLDLLLFTGYKNYLASTMHLEAISESYRELFDKNKKLQESLDRLKELDRLKSNFLATVSHELRTPLTSVIGYSEMLLDGLAGNLSTEQREYVQTIMEKGESLLNIISSILDVSKIEQGQLKLIFSPLDMRGLIEEAVQLARPLATRRRQQLEWSVADSLPVVRGDREKLRQVLLHLLSNAEKFTPDGGSIRIYAERAPMPGLRSDAAAALFSPDSGNAVRLRVSDSGIGIPADRVEKIFDIFYQVDNSSTREYGGCGLGLSIVKSYVEAHDGRVVVESEVGKGSTFSVYLPLQEER